jgi:hypothetical protein
MREDLNRSGLIEDTKAGCIQALGANGTEARDFGGPVMVSPPAPGSSCKEKVTSSHRLFAWVLWAPSRGWTIRTIRAGGWRITRCSCFITVEPHPCASLRSGEREGRSFSQDYSCCLGTSSSSSMTSMSSRNGEPQRISLGWKHRDHSVRWPIG